MSNESIIIGNINIFKDLNIWELCLNKYDLHFDELFTLWWRDPKIEVYILEMRRLRVRSKWAYDYYKHLFSSLVL